MSPEVGFSLQTVPPDEWDRKVAALPATHFLQSAAWAHFKSRQGWQSELCRIVQGQRVVAYASVLSRSLGPSPLRLAYVPRGPLLVDHKEPALAPALAALEKLARERRWLFIKVDPELQGDDAGTWAAATLRRRRWQPGEQVQFRNTVVMDITADEQSLLAAMKPKTRYNIRLAGRRGVKVTNIEAGYLDQIYSLYRETASRDGFIVRPRTYYQSLWSTLMETGMGIVLAAKYEGQIVAALVAIAYGDTAWYMHGASSSEHRNLMPTYLLQWEAIKWARTRGCCCYDMWGAPDTLSESDPMSGVLRFKLGFGGEFVQGLGAWDYTPSPRLYRAYCLAAPRILAAWRRLRSQTQRYE